MKRLLLFAALALAVPMTACAPPAGISNTVTAVGDQVTLKSTIALSLGELAFTSAEQTATAALKSGHLSKADAASLGHAVLTARGYRDQARSAVATGRDASAILTSLSAALANVSNLSAKAS